MLAYKPAAWLKMALFSSFLPFFENSTRKNETMSWLKTPFCWLKTAICWLTAGLNINRIVRNLQPFKTTSRPLLHHQIPKSIFSSLRSRVICRPLYVQQNLTILPEPRLHLIPEFHASLILRILPQRENPAVSVRVILPVEHPPHGFFTEEIPV